MVLTFRRMSNSIEINRLIESESLTVAVLIEKNSHGLGDNEPTCMNCDSVFLDLFEEF